MKRIAPTRVARSVEVGEAADAYANIEALFHQIDDSIDQQHACRDSRKSVQERGHHRQHVQPAKHDRCGEGKLAAGLGAFASHATPGIIELIKHLAASRGVGTAGLGKHQPPRGPRDEARVELVLERLQIAADGGQGHAELAPSRRQAAGLGDGDEHADSSEMVHRLLQEMEV